MDRTFRRTLGGYYTTEALNAFASTIIGSCIFFWTRARYGYSDTQNLMLGTLQGLLYATMPRLGGRLGDRFGYDRLLVIGAAGMLAAEVLLLTIHWAGMPVIGMPLFIAAMSLTWPVLEASVVVYPGPLSTPDRLGLYNVVWAFTAAVSFFIAGALFRITPDAILVAAVAAHVLMLANLLRPASRQPQTGGARASHRGDAVPRALKTRFIRLSWLGNGVGYVMQGGLMATAPAVGDRLGLPASSTIWLICTFFAARGVAFIALWKWTRWHYRLRWVALALVAGPAALAGVFFLPWTAAVFPMLVVFGASIGLCYYASIYYSLDFGEEKGEHGGAHEAIIGLGGLIGPLAGVAGATVLGSTAGAQGAIVAIAGAIAATGLAWAARRG
jgi:MFS family permease